MIFVKKIIALLFLIIMAGSLFAAQDIQKVEITYIKLTPVENKKMVEAIAEVIVNNKVRIKDIEVMKIAGRTVLKFPEYVSKAGKIYPQVALLTRRANEVFKKAVDNEAPTSKDSSKLNFRIIKFSEYKRKSSLKVFATVLFNDCIEIECRVMEGRYGPWIAWPAYKDEASKKWIKQVVFTDSNFERKVERALLRKYQVMLLEKGLD